MKSNSVTSGNSVSDEIVISRSEWDSLQCELDKLRALMGLGNFFIHTGCIEVIMQGKCGRNTETTFDIK